MTIIRAKTELHFIMWLSECDRSAKLLSNWEEADKDNSSLR